jgi:hypothetical protein
MLPRSVAVLQCLLGWRTLLKCNKTNHAVTIAETQGGALARVQQDDHGHGHGHGIYIDEK